MTDSEANDFAEFEAKAAQVDEPVVEAVDEPKEEKVDEPIEADDDAGKEEAVQDDEPEDTADNDAEDDAEDDTDKPKKRRSKPASERIAELTARLRETERELEAERIGKKPEETKQIEKPNPDDFEFGESDPDYLDKLTDYKLETRDAEKAKEQNEQRSQQAMFDKINTGVALAEETAKAKYDDFDEKIAEAVEARGGSPLPPLLTIGIGVSPVGGDIIYRLATDEAASDRMEKLAKGETANAMAMALGELEGEYLEDDSDSDLDMTDSMDMARMMGRMRARVKGTRAVTAKADVKLTQAPEPPKQRARGGSGQFSTPPDTTDFAAFEKLAASR